MNSWANTRILWLRPRGRIQQCREEQNQLWGFTICLLQTVHIYFYIHFQHMGKKKNPIQTVISSSDGMLNASTDSVHKHTGRTHAHDTRAYKHQHIRTFLSFFFTRNSTFYTNTPTLSSPPPSTFHVHTHIQTNQIRATCGRRLTLQDRPSTHSALRRRTLFFVSLPSCHLPETASQQQILNTENIYVSVLSKLGFLFSFFFTQTQTQPTNKERNEKL